MKKILLLALSTQMAQPVIISESVVRTPDHIMPLSLLAKGYKLASLAKDKQTKALVEIKSHKKTTVDELYLIRAGDNLVRAAKGQTFYDPVLQKWVKSEHLNSANHLLDEKGKRVAVDSIVHRLGQFPAIEIEVDGSHYLFSDGALTHNDGGASLVAGVIIFVGGVFARWFCGSAFTAAKGKVDRAYDNAIRQQESHRVNGKPQGPTIRRYHNTGARMA
jgi:hypothetical protein